MLAHALWTILPQSLHSLLGHLSALSHLEPVHNLVIVFPDGHLMWGTSFLRRFIIASNFSSARKGFSSILSILILFILAARYICVLINKIIVICWMELPYKIDTAIKQVLF